MIDSEYVKKLENTIIELLDGVNYASEIVYHTGMSKKKADEILELRNKLLEEK